MEKYFRFSFSDGETCEYPLPGGKNLSFYELPSFAEEIENHPKHLEQLNKIIFILNHFAGFEALTRDKIAQIFAIVTRNQVDIYDGRGSLVGSGIFFVASEFEHSCQPNCVFDFDGKILDVKYLGPDKLSGPVHISRDLTVCRVDFLLDTPTRQKFLEEKFAIKCNCLKCQRDPLEVDVLKQGCLKCRKCAAAVPVPSFKKKGLPKHFKCPKCHVTVLPETLELFWILKPKLKKIAEGYLKDNGGPPDPSIRWPDWKIIVEAEKVVHCYDLDFLICMMCALDFGLDNNRYKGTLSFGLKVLEAHHRYVKIPSYSMMTAHFRISGAAKLMNKVELQMEHREKAMQLVSIIHGSYHPLYPKFVPFESWRPMFPEL